METSILVGGDLCRGSNPPSRTNECSSQDGPDANFCPLLNFAGEMQVDLLGFQFLLRKLCARTASHAVICGL